MFAHCEFMQTITLTLTPSPRMPLKVLDQVIQRAESERCTPEEWVFAQIEKGLSTDQAAQAPEGDRAASLAA